MNQELATDALAVASVQDFHSLLASVTGLEVELSRNLSAAVGEIIEALGPAKLPANLAMSHFYGRINQKLVANRDVIAEIYGFAAGHGITFNYPSKKAIAWAVDTRDEDAFSTFMARSCSERPDVLAGLRERFQPIEHAQTMRLIGLEATNPTKLRKAHAREVAADVLEAAAGPLVWSLWPSEALHDVNQPPSTRTRYTGEYMTDLRADQPALFARDRALVIAFVNPIDDRYDELRAGLCDWLADEYERVNNYGFVSVVLDCDVNPKAAWELSADLSLFAERFHEHPLQNGYFKPSEVERETLGYVPADPSTARFDLVNEGFTYRDLFILQDEQGGGRRLLLLFQKNRRDETRVPCPACRSSNVRGNSYPSLGVKSWECQNLLCPDRSIYNRGKRYSFKALLAQEAIEHPANEIPVASVRRWQRDVLGLVNEADVVDALVRHYSMVGDSVVLLDSPCRVRDAHGREIFEHRRSTANVKASAFWTDAAYFNRYAVASAPVFRCKAAGKASFQDAWNVLEGDSYDMLAQIADDTFDRAVTSPPYFNARDYAQWPNLYCYLYDMQRINAQVFRTLKPGALYAYNIFDYFDNERTVVFSAMGNKRIALSAVMVDLFRRIGFEFVGNAVWDKGDIQGKRGFNAGNFTPFYQAPFNCWEHVLLVRKPVASGEQAQESPYANRVLPIHPVIKIIRGENQYGHTAPYPVELAQAFLEGLAPGQLVLDPFGGSGTTGRAAMNLSLRSVVVERDPGYCDLSRQMLKQHEADLQFESRLW